MVSIAQNITNNLVHLSQVSILNVLESKYNIKLKSTLVFKFQNQDLFNYYNCSMAM